MSKSLLTVLCLVVIGLGVAGSSFVPAASAAPTSQPSADSKPCNTKCPVTGEDIDPSITQVYDGKTYAFCCADCIKAFNKDPAKYAAKAK